MARYRESCTRQFLAVKKERQDTRRFPAEGSKWVNNQIGNTQPCPRCGQAVGIPVKFTWWGGILGPKIFHHVRCPACRYEYNGKTGASNSTAVTIYLVVSVLIGLLIGVVIFMSAGKMH